MYIRGWEFYVCSVFFFVGCLDFHQVSQEGTPQFRAANYCYRQPNSLAIVAMATKGLVEDSSELLQFKIKK